MLKGDDVDVEQELAEFRREEERKFQKALREVDEDIDKQLREEEQRLERLKRIEIEEFEQHEKKQQDLAARREDQAHQQFKDEQRRELELAKLKLEQQYQDDVEAFRREQQSRTEHEKLDVEEARQRKFQQIAESIDSLNLGAADKKRLKEEIDSLSKEQDRMQSLIRANSRQIEDEQAAVRNLKRELDELGL